MMLLVDIGNTRLKLGWLGAQGQREARPLAVVPEQFATTLGPWLSALPEVPTAILGASVATADLTRQVSDWLQDHTGLSPQWQSARAYYRGLTNGYRQPRQLGVDRWLALLGLWAHPQHQTARPARWVRLLATFGTATTIDTLTPEGKFLGGLILPGLELMRSALVTGTAQLPAARGAPMAYPDDTHSAIATGILAAQVGAVRRQLDYVGRDFPGTPCRLTVCGGALDRVIGELTESLASLAHQPVLEIVDNPVLDGLAILAADASKP